MSVSAIFRSCVQASVVVRTFQHSICSSLVRRSISHQSVKHNNLMTSSFPSNSTLLVNQSLYNQSPITVQAKRFLPTLNQVRRQKPRTKRKRAKPVIPANRRILLGPQRKGVCVKNVVRTPRKPNSAQRKCAVLRLNDGRLITAYIPGEKANLQEHGVVLFRGGRVQDCPGLKYKIIRGVYDMN